MEPTVQPFAFSWVSLVGPAVVAAAVSGIVTTIGFFINRSTSLTTHRERLKADGELAERKVNADIALAERRFSLEVALADRKRRQELAEDVLAGFLQMQDIMPAIRSPGSFSAEAEGRPKTTGGTESVSRMRDTYYVTLARLEARREIIANLMSKKYRTVALLGPKAAAPFDDLHKVLTEIRVAASLLVEWSGKGVYDSDRALWRKMEAKVWEGAEDPDPLNPIVEKAIAEIDSLCRPVLETPPLA